MCEQCRSSINSDRWIHPTQTALPLTLGQGPRISQYSKQSSGGWWWEYTCTVMSFFSRGLQSGHSSPKQKKISNGGGVLVWPFWNRMSSALRVRPLVRGKHQAPGWKETQRNMRWGPHHWGSPPGWRAWSWPPVGWGWGVSPGLRRRARSRTPCIGTGGWHTDPGLVAEGWAHGPGRPAAGWYKSAASRWGCPRGWGSALAPGSPGQRAPPAPGWPPVGCRRAGSLEGCWWWEPGVAVPGTGTWFPGQSLQDREASPPRPWAACLPILPSTDLSLSALQPGHHQSPPLSSQPSRDWYGHFCSSLCHPPPS